MQIWLRTNVRVLWLQLIPAVLLMLSGIAGMVWAWTAGQWIFLGAALGIGVTAVVWLWRLHRAFRRPCIAYHDGQVLVDVTGNRLVAVPLDAVECFLLGQGEAGERSHSAKSLNVIVRLAEAATQWHQRPVNSRLARWCGGYITLSGLWCEPLGVERLRDLNHQLASAKRSRKKG